MCFCLHQLSYCQIDAWNNVFPSLTVFGEFVIKISYELKVIEVEQRRVW